MVGEADGLDVAGRGVVDVAAWTGCEHKSQVRLHQGLSALPHMPMVLNTAQLAPGSAARSAAVSSRHAAHVGVTLLGAFVGTDVGVAEGAAVVGASVGAALLWAVVGSDVGAAEWAAVVGASVGAAVGCTLGPLVGVTVGEALVGSDVGTVGGRVPDRDSITHHTTK